MNDTTSISHRPYRGGLLTSIHATHDSNRPLVMIATGDDGSTSLSVPEHHDMDIKRARALRDCLNTALEIAGGQKTV